MSLYICTFALILNASCTIFWIESWELSLFCSANGKAYIKYKYVSKTAWVPGQPQAFGKGYTQTFLALERNNVDNLAEELNREDEVGARGVIKAV